MLDNLRLVRSVSWVTILSIWIIPLLMPAHTVFAEDGVTFHDIAPLPESGITYQRTRSAHATVWDEFVARGTFRFPDELAFQPFAWRGKPGVAVLDYDNDDDLDLYVTNGPGTNNSLYANQFTQTGQVTFVDVATAANVGAQDQDSAGVCFGDTDNDGDHDLFVLSSVGTNRFFVNDGDGTFTDLSAASGLGVDNRSSYSCSFGDVNADGLLDVAIANSISDPSNILGLVIPFELTQHNQLFLNHGNNVFTDASATSGLENTKGFGPFDGSPSPTWAIAMVDYDLDGDLDIIHADDQAGVPRTADGGIDIAFIHIFENDGTGNFIDVTIKKNTNRVNTWMGLSFGDLNSDGYMDLFGTATGDYIETILTPLDPFYSDAGNYPLGRDASRWLLGGPDGVFSDPGVGNLVATPFGWGTSMFDYDNDADTDIVFHGGLAFGIVVHDGNPGAILTNDGAANFTYDAASLATSTDHQRRNTQGVAVGDLNHDGFGDIVVTSSMDKQSSIPLRLYQVAWGSPFDGTLAAQTTFVPSETPGLLVYSGIEDNIDGTLSVELNSGNNGNGWIKVELLGTVGLASNGMVNRDGIGAVVEVETNDGKRTMRPVTGGSSHLSQDSLVLEFGLGTVSEGTIDVLWPGSGGSPVRNRLYEVQSGEHVLFPEIPCSYDGDWTSTQAYHDCVQSALDELVNAGAITQGDSGKFLSSALRAFHEEEAADAATVDNFTERVPIDVPGAVLTWVHGINNQGQIVGYYTDANRMDRGFVLTDGQIETIDVPNSNRTRIFAIANNGIEHSFTATWLED